MSAIQPNAADQARVAALNMVGRDSGAAARHRRSTCSDTLGMISHIVRQLAGACPPAMAVLTALTDAPRMAAISVCNSGRRVDWLQQRGLDRPRRRYAWSG